MCNQKPLKRTRLLKIAFHGPLFITSTIREGAEKDREMRPERERDGWHEIRVFREKVPGDTQPHLKKQRGSQCVGFH